jgi:hypothetical protein
MRLQVDVPALAAQRLEIGDRRLGAGQDHRVGVAGQRLAGLHQDELDIGLRLQRIEVVEIRDARQARHRDLDDARAVARRAQREAAAVEPGGVLGRQARGTREPRHQAEIFDARARDDLASP